MPFLNAERFIKDAIESVLAQTFQNWELLLVDDGSNDSSTTIAAGYVARLPQQVSYVEHQDHRNRGISASRNAGIRHAKGKYVAFLDADDLWLPHRLKSQVAILESEPKASLVYGLSQYWYGWTGKAEDLQRDFIPDLGIPTETLYAPPALLLNLYPLGQGTAPSMSNLLVRREFVETVGGFEEEFRGLYEDQAFLVKAYLHGSIFVSGECWDKYRIHPESCLSVGTEAGQYQTVRLRFLEWFESYLQNQGITDGAIQSALRKAFETRRTPQEVVHYGGWLFRVAGSSEAHLVIPPERPDAVRILIDKNASQAPYDIQLNQPRLKVQADRRYRVLFQARADRARSIRYGVALAHEPWTGLGLYRKAELTPKWQSVEAEFVAAADEDNARIHFDLGDSDVPVELASVSLRLPGGDPAPGSVQFGTLRRVTPVSRMWGYDRGLPIDRYYIEAFLARQAGDIRGRVLEIEDSTYTRRFGSRVTRSDILHVNDSNPLATIVGDLTDAPQIPSNTFDCIILTQTLQLIYEVRAAIRTLYRILRPGGVVLATFPGISQNNDRDWNDNWHWGFTPLSGRRLFEEAFAPELVKIEAAGNVLTAASFLYGLSSGELTREELDYAERGYEVTIGVRAAKSEEPT
jgi:glycosyltransferase involved in cell wall biosynthesis/SAM-dependent methyltransferase